MTVVPAPSVSDQLFDELFPSPRAVPLRAIAISLGALAVPVLVTLLWPDALWDHEPLLWLTALVPAFLLAYYWGITGVATAIAAAMAALTLTHDIAVAVGRPLESGPVLGLVVTAYMAICLGIAWLTDKLHREREQLVRDAFEDPQTGLASRRYGAMFLTSEFAAARRGRKLCIALFDVQPKDDGEAPLTMRGRQRQALRGLASQLLALTRSSSLSVRLDDHFLIVLPDCEARGAIAYVRRLRERLALKSLRGFTFNAGIAEYNGTMTGPQDLLAAAEGALGRARAEGPNRLRVSDRVRMFATVEVMATR